MPASAAVAAPCAVAPLAAPRTAPALDQDFEDDLCSTFANLVRSGLVDRATLVDEGFTEAATRIMASPLSLHHDEDASPPRKRATRAARRGREDDEGHDRGADDGARSQ